MRVAHVHVVARATLWSLPFLRVTAFRFSVWFCSVDIATRKARVPQKKEISRFFDALATRESISWEIARKKWSLDWNICFLVVQAIAFGVSYHHWISNLNQSSRSLGLLCHVLFTKDKWDWNWRLRLNDIPNAIIRTNVFPVEIMLDIQDPCMRSFFVRFSFFSRVPDRRKICSRLKHQPGISHIGMGSSRSKCKWVTNWAETLEGGDSATNSWWSDVTHSYVKWLIRMWHDPLTYDMIHSYVTWPIFMWHDSFLFDTNHSSVTSLIHVWHDSFTCDMTHSRVRWLFTCDMTHSYVTRIIQAWQASFICDMAHSYMTWLIQVWQDSFGFRM